MKYLFTTLFTLLALVSSGQSKEQLLGAWERQGSDENTQILVITKGFWSLTEFNQDQKNFIGTMGGAWDLSATKMSYTYEFSTFAEVLHGQLLPETVSQTSTDMMSLGATQWKRLDAGTPGALSGAWLITGRERDGSMSTITPGARKTMKILSGTRFQWIAYNTETRAFLGTGGGTYTTEYGKYSENIDFFSRDNSRVGASLGFDFEMKEGHWHHRGKSSKGQPIYEVWSKR